MLKLYLNQLWNTCTSPLSYLSILNSRARSSFFFFSVSFIWLGWLWVAGLSKHELPKVVAVISSLSQEAIYNFPEDGEILWKNNTLHTTPEVFRVPTLSTTIDTTGAVTRTDSSQFTVTQQDLLYTDQGVTIAKTPLTDVISLISSEAEISITKENSQEKITQFTKSILQIISELKLILLLFAPLSLMLLRLLTTSIDAALITLVSKLWKVQLGYTQWWQIGLHVAVACELLTQTVYYIYGNQPYPIYALSYWLLHFILFFTLKDIRKVVIKPTKKPTV